MFERLFLILVFLVFVCNGAFGGTLFSDSFEIVKPGKSILLTKTIFEKIKKLLKDLPFYFEPKE